MHWSTYSTKLWNDSVALYGSKTISDVFYDGTTVKVSNILSAYSSFNLYTKSVPIPEPVPPPIEWVI